MIALNTIYQEDCLSTMAKMEAGCIDLVITSPPYDEFRDYDGKSNFDFAKVSLELYRIIKDGGIVVWIVGDQVIDGSESGTSFKQALAFMQLGFTLHDTMIYQKKPMGALGSSNRYLQCFEYMFILSKGKPKTVNLICDRKNNWTATSKKPSTRQKDGTVRKHKQVLLDDYGRRTNVWLLDQGYMKSTIDKIAYKHPAIFPEKLANDHLITWSNRGDIIYDPFMGSGTVAKVCKVNSRNYIGSEINPDYIAIAKQRLMF